MGEQNRGFSLIELILALGLLAFLSLALFTPLQRFKQTIFLSLAGQTTVSELRYLQSTALATSGEKAKTLTNRGLPSGVLIRGAKPIVFAASGFPTVGGSGTQYLYSQSGQSRKLIVSSIGRVRLE